MVLVLNLGRHRRRVALAVELVRLLSHKTLASHRTCPAVGQVSMQRGFFQMLSTCPACQGTGTVIEEPCPDCTGGLVEAASELEIDIPAGWKP